MTICFQYARQRQIFYVRTWRYSEYMSSSDCQFVITGKVCNSVLIKILQTEVLPLLQWILITFSKTWLPAELQRVLPCESPAVFLHFPRKEKGLWGTFYQLQQVIAKGRHLLQILLKALDTASTINKK